MQRPIAAFFRPACKGACKPPNKQQAFSGDDLTAPDAAACELAQAAAVAQAAAPGCPPASGVQQFARKRKR